MTPTFRLSLFSAALLLAGCENPDRALLVTTSNFGIDVDVATQQLDVGLNRFEGVIAPVYDDGATPPVYARLGTDGGFFTPKISQLYTTGDAALIGSGRVHPIQCYEWATDAHGNRTRDWSTPIDPNHLSKNWTDADVSCDEPTALEDVGSAKRKRMYFATGTSLGLSLKTASGAPGSIHLGYKRFELSIIPLTKVYNTQNEATGAESYASTLGAIDMRIREDCSSSKLTNENGNCISQFFATGEAAKGVAGQPEIIEFFGRDAGEAFAGAGQ